MYVAYSDVLHDVVNINDAYNINEVFRCPNPNCSARLKIKGSTGDRAKHFARLPSTRHIDGCDYEFGDSRYAQPALLKKSTLEYIFSKRTSDKRMSTPHTPGTSAANILAINTPKKLLKYCRLNSLNTEYLPGMTVDDIIVENRNLIQGGKFQGVNGLRIVVGHTINYDSEAIYLLVTATTKRDKQVKLKASVKMDSDLLKYVRKHIIETQEKFGGYEIGIFGNWVTSQKYHILCNVSDQKHIILRI